MGNRERIVEASLALFNEDGVKSVTTNHIAAHISISPGNLYYHFRNKEEIIREIFPRIAAAVENAIVLPQGREVSAEDVGRYHLAGIRSLWEFRFFFRDLSELTSRDPMLAELCREMQQGLLSAFESLLERLRSQGLLRVTDPDLDLGRVAVNAVILWTNWINFLATSRPSPAIEPADIVEGALQSFLTLSPLLDDSFAAEVRAMMLNPARGGGDPPGASVTNVTLPAS